MSSITLSTVHKVSLPLNEAQTEDVKAQMLQELSKNNDEVGEGGLSNRITILGRHHALVFVDKDLPGLVFKLCVRSAVEEMLQNQKKSQAVVESKKLNRCIIPASDMILLDGSKKALFVMKKVKRTPSESKKMVLNAYRAFFHTPDHSETVTLKEALRDFFRQAAVYICESGYWDISWDNILYTKKGFAFIDFEGVEPTQAKIALGIGRLLSMAHPDFFPTIVEVADLYGADIQSIFFNSFDKADGIERAMVIQKFTLRTSYSVQCRQ